MFSVKIKSMQEVEKILQTWYYVALIFEVALFFGVIAFVSEPNLLFFGIVMIFLTTTLALHLMIQVGDIQIQLAKIANKKL